MESARLCYTKITDLILIKKIPWWGHFQTTPFYSQLSLEILILFTVSFEMKQAISISTCLWRICLTVHDAHVAIILRIYITFIFVSSSLDSAMYSLVIYKNILI